MHRLFSDRSLSAIRTRLSILYLLNLCDIGLTLLLLSTGAFREVNPLMGQVIGSPWALWAVKLTLPAMLLLWLAHRLTDATPRQLRACSVILNILSAGYLTVNFQHLIFLAGAAGIIPA